MNYWEEEDYTRRLDLGLWKRLLRYARPYYGHLGLIALTMLVCAAIDVIFPLLTREAIDQFVLEGTLDHLGLFALKSLACVVVQAFTVFLFCYLSGRVETGLCHRIRKLGFKRLQELSFSYYDRTSVGYLITRLTTDTQRLGDTVGWGLVDLLWALGFLVMTAGSYAVAQLEAGAVSAERGAGDCGVGGLFSEADPRQLSRGAQTQFARYQCF